MNLQSLIRSTRNKKVKRILNLLYHRIYINPKLENDIVNRFHKLYYDSNIFGRSWGNTHWLGVRALKCPLDLWLYQEIIHELQPDLIVETGTAGGGSALFLASICDLVGNGAVVTIDIEAKEGRPRHPRITYLHGSSTAEGIVDEVRKLAERAGSVMVVLDSDHNKDHVLVELSLYSRFVTPGSYLIVEDTNVNGHPVFPEHGPGPMEAVAEFLKEQKGFVVDKDKEKFFLTFNPNGYLRKIA
jgi:cephalosporin hydroxylase